MVNTMAAKILALILASSLLGAAPGCRCEAPKPEPQKTSCGHCPEESSSRQTKPLPSECCCDHEGTDRNSEDAFVLPSNFSDSDAVFNPNDVIALVLDDDQERPPPDIRVLLGSGPPLHLLFRHLVI